MLGKIVGSRDSNYFNEVKAIHYYQGNLLAFSDRDVHLWKFNYPHSRSVTTAKIFLNGTVSILPRNSNIIVPLDRVRMHGC
jgi:hypothetical protein